MTETISKVKTEYPISSNYCAKWSVVEGIREIIANAMDTKQSYTIQWHDGYGYIEDTGRGFPKECLILGEGEEKNDTQIGQFREGLKIAGLVFARIGRSFSGSTVGYDFQFYMGASAVFDCDVLFMEFDPNDRWAGTLIKFECSESELDVAKSLFLTHATDEPFLVPDRPGQLFINKVFVHSIDNAMYGYNIADKNAANRDRSILNMEHVKKAISRIWEKIDNAEYIEAYLSAGEQYIEHDVIVHVSELCKPAWYKVLARLHGSKYCLFDTPENAHQIIEWGYQVITPISWDQAYTLHSYLNVPYCADVLSERIKEDYVDYMPKLSPQQLRLYNIAVNIATAYYEEPINIMVVEKLSHLTDSDCLAHTDHEANVIRITPRLIDKGLKVLTGAIVHEQTHLLHGHNDATRAFEHDLTSVIGDLIVKLNKHELLQRSAQNND